MKRLHTSTSELKTDIKAVFNDSQATQASKKSRSYLIAILISYPAWEYISNYLISVSIPRIKLVLI